MSSTKNKLLNCFISCGYGCRKPNPSQETQPRLPKHENPKLSGSSRPSNFPDRDGLFPTMIADDDQEEEEGINGYTASSQDNGDGFSFEVEPRMSMRVVSPCRKISNSIAFVKESENPYWDFRRSMLQMVFEREIRSKGDFEELLNCFLQLNPPSQHNAIILAFTEIWNRVFSDKIDTPSHDQRILELRIINNTE